MRAVSGAGGGGAATATTGDVSPIHGSVQMAGMGLGLAMVKNIVENHDGALWFETELGEGSSFFVSFPKKITLVER